jgi:uncharacterized caspase-like protein
MRSVTVMRSRVVVGALALGLLLLLPLSAAAQAPRGGSLTEDRVALVIGNAAYKNDPLDNPVNDVRLIGSRLEQAGFKVTRRENLDRNGMAAALRDFGAALNENTVAVLYYAGHALQLRDQNYMIPIDAEIRSEDDIGLQGVDLTFILGRMSRAKSRVNVVILDACRDNPFAKRAGGNPSNASGLAQMDAPIGTLLAYATAPGKQAPDGIGKQGNSIYTAELARHLLTPGLPVELMFKRVREGVVRESRQLQVPWEHSSLLGEFAFVPGFAGAPAPTATAAAAGTAEADAAAEAALWSSVQGAARADEFRAYLRQYPNGRFADAARQRIAALSVPAPAGGSTRADLMPKVGDTWRYRVTDQHRFGDVFVTARVDAVSADGVAETWTTTVDAKVRTTRVPLKPAFNPLPDWDAAPPEFAPYLQATELPPGVSAAIGAQRSAIEAVSVTLQPSWKGEEDVVVGAGRFRAQKLVLSGKTSGRGGPVSAQYTVWYAPAAKRIIKYEVLGQAGRNRQSTTFELTEYKLQ